MKLTADKLSFLFSLLLLFLIFPSAQGAESTEDITVDPAMKEKARLEIMGQNNIQQVDDEYTIGYRDILSVSIFDEGSMIAGPTSSSNNQQKNDDFIRGRGEGVEVRMDGRISLRHIGDVFVVGMTLTQLADYLKKLYSPIYESPSLTVTLIQGNSRYYIIMGKVVNTGLYHLDFPITIVGAVARAGGFNEWADSDITVIRKADKNIGAYNNEQDNKGEKKHFFEFDYDDFLDGKDLEKNISIKPDDVIVVH